jgi:hypothetical protein
MLQAITAHADLGVPLPPAPPMFHHSDPLLDRARQRCADLPWATLLGGDARSLPAEDASVDVVAIYRS